MVDPRMCWKNGAASVVSLPGLLNTAVVLVIWMASAIMVAAISPNFASFFSAMVLVTGIATSGWVQIRTGGVVACLCRREWREQLAVTPLRPDVYLLSRVRPQISHVIVPGATVTPVLVVLMLADVERTVLSRTMAQLVAFWFVGFACLAVVVSVAGAFDCLRRSCGGGWNRFSPYVCGAAWWVASLVACLAVAIVTRAIADLTHPIDVHGYFMFFASGSIQAASLVLATKYAKRQWGRACEAYYEFD